MQERYLRHPPCHGFQCGELAYQPQRKGSDAREIDHKLTRSTKLMAQLVECLVGIAGISDYAR